MALLRKLMDRTEAPSQLTILENLERLVRHAHEERKACQALLASAEEHTKRIPQVNESLDESERRAVTLAERLESLAIRMDDLDGVNRQIQALEARVVSLEGGVQKAEDRVEHTLAREADVQEHRNALEQLVSLGRTTMGQIEGLKHERAVLAQLEERLPRLRMELEPLVDQHGALKTDLDLLRAGIAALAQDADTGREAALKARSHAAKATDVVADLQRKLEPLAELRALSDDTEEKLRSLNGLAEHVAAKVNALESQQSVVEHALVESRRVHEMVWDMEVQIGKLTEGSKRATRVEETLARLERLQSETTAQLEEATRARDVFDQEVTRQERDARGLIQVVQTHLDQLVVSKQDLETLHERLRLAQAGIVAAESRMEAVSAHEQELAQLLERIETLATSLQELTDQADSLERKQTALAALEERLDALEEAAKRTHWQFEGLAEHRKDLDVLKEEIQLVHATYERTSTLLEKLRSDKREIEQCLDKSGGFMSQASEIDARIEALSARLGQAEASVERTSGMAAAVEDLAGTLEAVTPRLRIVDDLEDRLNALNGLSTEVDRRLSDQLARRAELESLGVACDGLTVQMTDAQQKLAAIGTTQAELEPVFAQVAALQADVLSARAALQALARDEEELAAQDRRFADLAEASRALSVEIADRLSSVQSLQTDLGKAAALREELLGELARIQKQERETFARFEAAEDQFRRLDSLWKRLEQRRAELEDADRIMADVQERMSELGHLAEEVDRKIEAIADREQVVDAVRRGIESVHAVGLKSQADLDAIAERRTEIAQARSELERFSDSLAATQERLAAIENRRPVVDDVQRKADAIAHILGDVQITLESVSEQKAMVDHVFAELARLEYLVQEARGTMKALQAERDVAQRIAENVRLIHARALGEERTMV